MDYCRVVGGNPTTFYTADHVVEFLRNGGNVRARLREMTNTERLSVGYYPTQVMGRPDERYYQVAQEPTKELVGEVVQLTYTGTLRSDDDLRQIRMREVASIRYERENREVNVGTFKVSASKDTRDEVDKLKKRLTDGLLPLVEFKPKTGLEPIPMNLAAVTIMDDVLTIYSQGCRSHEAWLIRELLSAIGEAILAVDLNDGWPSEDDPMLALGRANMISLVERRASALEAGGYAEEAQALRRRYGVN